MQVQAIYSYPIKSLRGISLPSTLITHHGLPHDRHFMLLRDHHLPNSGPRGGRYENMHVSGYPQLSLFRTAFLPDAADPVSILVTYTSPTDPSDVRTLHVPLYPDIETLDMLPVNMHQSRTLAHVMPEAQCAWFSGILGFEVLLVYLGDNQRPVLGNVAPNAAARNPVNRERRRRGDGTYEPVDGRGEGGGKGWVSAATGAWAALTGGGGGQKTVKEGKKWEDMQDSKAALAWKEGKRLKAGEIDVGIYEEDDYTITFQDCAPYMIVSAASHAVVQEKFGDEILVDLTKFRPNLVLAGAALPAWDEDYWAELSISPSAPSSREDGTRTGDTISLTLSGNCIRCSSLNVDYSTGAVGKGALGNVLKSLMKDRRVDGQHKYAPVFGRYGFTTRAADGLSIGVGDMVEVSRRNQERDTTRWPGIAGLAKEDIWVL